MSVMNEILKRLILFTAGALYGSMIFWHIIYPIDYVISHGIGTGRNYSHARVKLRTEL